MKTEISVEEKKGNLKNLIDHIREIDQNVKIRELKGWMDIKFSKKVRFAMISYDMKSKFVIFHLDDDKIYFLENVKRMTFRCDGVELNPVRVDINFTPDKVQVYDAVVNYMYIIEVEGGIVVTLRSR